MSLIELSEYLQEALNEKGWNSRQLAIKAGIDPGITARAINMQRMPRPKTLAAIAEALGRPTEEIYRVAGILPQSNNIPPEISRAMYQLEQLPEPLRSILTKMIDAQYQQWENEQTASLKTKPRPNS